MTDPRRPGERSPNWVYWIGGLVFAMYVADQFRPKTASERAQERESSAQREAEQAQAKREMMQEQAANGWGYDFWLPGAEGRRLLDAATLTRIPIEDPYPDAQRKASSVSSEQAGVTLGIWQPYEEARGWLTLYRGDEKLVGFEFDRTIGAPMEYMVISDDLPRLKVVARLFASAGSGTLFVRRTDWPKAQLRIWEAYLRRHPDVAEEIGWTGSGPYRYLDRGLTAFDYRARRS